MNTLLLLGRMLLISIVPSFFLIIAGANEFDDWFNVVNIEGMSLHQKKILALIIGLLFTGAVLPIENYLLKRRIRKLENFYDGRLDELKITFDHLLSGLLKVSFDKASYRLFLPKRGLRYFLPEGLGKRVVMEYRPLKGLYRDDIKPLQFTVFPEEHSQGLIGISYVHRAIPIRDNDHMPEQYREYYGRMTTFQQTVARNHRFVMTIPVINEKDQILAIVSVDSVENLGIKKDQVSQSVTHHLLALGIKIYEMYLNILRK